MAACRNSFATVARSRSVSRTVSHMILFCTKALCHVTMCALNACAALPSQLGSSSATPAVRLAAMSALAHARLFHASASDSRSPQSPPMVSVSQCTTLTSWPNWRVTQATASLIQPTTPGSTSVTDSVTSSS